MAEETSYEKGRDAAKNDEPRKSPTEPSLGDAFRSNEEVKERLEEHQEWHRGYNDEQKRK